MSLDRDKAFERELRQAKPAMPSDLLVANIDAAIKKAEEGSRRRKYNSLFAWGGFVAAASIMLVLGLMFFNGIGDLSTNQATVAENPEPLTVPAVDVESDSFKSVLAQNNLQERVDEGIVFLNNGLTARKYRYQFIDRVVWRNPANGAVVEMEVPRDEVVLIPVQTF